MLRRRATSRQPKRVMESRQGPRVRYCFSHSIVRMPVLGGRRTPGCRVRTRARKEIRTPRGQSCGAGPPLEIIVYPAAYGVAGALAGGVTGWTWPRHHAADTTRLPLTDKQRFTKRGFGINVPPILKSGINLPEAQ
jgi:hypothetical protein